MKKFTLRDLDEVKKGQAIVGRVKSIGMVGFVVPATIGGNNKKYKTLMEIFFRVFNRVSGGQMWRGYIVDIDLETDGPVKLVLEEVAPRVYGSILWEEATKRPDKTYYTFI